MVIYYILTVVITIIVTLSIIYYISVKKAKKTMNTIEEFITKGEFLKPIDKRDYEDFDNWKDKINEDEIKNKLDSWGTDYGNKGI